MLDRFQANKTETVAFLLGSLGVFPAILGLGRAGDWKGLASYSTFIFAVFFLYARLLPAPRREIPRTKHFSGIGTPREPSNLCARDRETAIVFERIIASAHKLCVIAGPSGGGKTVLVRRLLPRFEGWQTVVVAKYDNIESDLSGKLSDALGLSSERIHDLNTDWHAVPRRKPRLLLIFDQAEQLAARNAQELNWIRQLFEVLLSRDEVRCVVISRQDFLYDLRFLGGLLPSPADAINIAGLETTLGTPELAAAERALRIVCTAELAEAVVEDLGTIELQSTFNPALGCWETRAVKTMLPIDLQMIGFVLDVENTRTGLVDIQAYRDRLGGKNGVIRRYFMVFLEACPEPAVAWTVLFALSTGAVIQRGLSLRDIERITYAEPESIKSVLDFCTQEDHPLLTQPTLGWYQWSHDSLWSRFRDISAAEMEPAFRDNAMYLRDRLREVPAFASRILPTDDRRVVVRERIMRASFVFAALVIFARALASGLNVGTGDVSALKSFYVPFGVADLTWAIFFYRLRPLYTRLRTSSAWLPWWVLPVTGIGAVVITCISPRTWVAALSTTALVLGLWLLMVSCLDGLSNQSREKFRAFAKDCWLFGGAMCGVIGLVYVVHFDKFVQLFGAGNFYLWSAVLSLVFCSFAFSAIHDRTTQGAMTAYLGFLDRTASTAATGTSDASWT